MKNTEKNTKITLTFTKKRQAKAENSFYVPSEAKVALVIRIKGVNKMHPDRRTIMRLLRLR